MSFAANPRALNNPPYKDDVTQEPVGPVAADSLAAESLNQSGGFADGDAVPLSVKGNQSTLNTTDTSAAVPLHPATSGAVREREDALGAGSDEKGVSGLKYPDALDGQGEFSSRHNLDGYAGGPSSDRPSGGYSTQPAGDSDFGSNTISGFSESSSEIKSSSNTDAVPGSVKGATATPSSGSDGPANGAGIRPYVDSAPNYAAHVSGAISSEGEGKPKGENLTEGNVPQTKTFTGDVGGPHDPGRLAEQGFKKANADTAGSGGARDYSQGGGNQYGTLSSSERA